MTDVIGSRIEIVQGAGGPKARIAGHRIRVQDVAIWHEEMGMSPEEIVRHYPTITLTEVHAALAYYREHRAEIGRAIADECAYIEEHRRGHTSLLDERLKRRRRLTPA
jgi:uncharacterized protein (DUF433 family)